MRQSADEAKGSLPPALWLPRAGIQPCQGFPASAAAELTARKASASHPETSQSPGNPCLRHRSPRGYVYGLLELAERVQFSASPAAALHLTDDNRREARQSRSAASAAISAVKLKTNPGTTIRNSGARYLDALVASRFNRFSPRLRTRIRLSPAESPTTTFTFPIPDLFEVPGYEGVRVMQLSEPDGNASSCSRSAYGRRADKEF